MPLMTANEFAQFVDRDENRDRKFELVRGETIELPFGSIRHGAVCGDAAHLLGSFAKHSRRGFVCCNNPGIQVARDPDTVRGPDIAFFPGTPRSEDEGRFSDTPPILIVEVVDDCDTTEAIYRRIREFHAFGTPTVWVIDPPTGLMTVLRSNGIVDVLRNDQLIVDTETMPGFACKAAEFFSLPGQ